MFAESPDLDPNLDIGQYQDYANVLKDIDGSQAALLLSTQGLSNAQIQQTLAAKGLTTEQQLQAMVEAGLLTSKKSLTDVELKSNMVKALSVKMSKEEAEKKANELIQTMGLTVAKEGEAAQTVKLTSAKLSELVATGKLNKELAEEIAMRTGVSLAIDKQNSSSLPAWLDNLNKGRIALGKQIKDTGIWIKSLSTTSKVLGGIGLAVGAGIAIYSAVKKHREDLRAAAEEAATVYEESSSAVEEYASRYSDLRKQLMAARGDEEATYNVKKQLLELQTELNEKYGAEYGKLDLVTEAYRDQTETIREYNKEAANTFLTDNWKGYQNAVKAMEKDNRHYSLSVTGLSSFTEEGQALKELAEKYSDQGVSLLDEWGDGNYSQFSIHLTSDADSAYETINNFSEDVWALAKELGDEHLFDDILNITSKSSAKAKEVIEKNADIYKQGLMAELTEDDAASGLYGEALSAVEAYNEAIAQSEDPYNDENVQRALTDLENVKSKTEEIPKYSYLWDSLFEGADTTLIDFNNHLLNTESLIQDAESLKKFDANDLYSFDQNEGSNEAFDRLKASADAYGLEVEDLINALIRLGYIQGEVIGEQKEFKTSLTYEEMGAKLQGLSSGFNPLMDIFEDVKNAGTFDWSSIFNNEEFKAQFGDMANATAEYKNAYNEFLETVGNSPDDINACQSAFNNLATAYVQNSGILKQLTEDTKELTINELEHMGVANAEEVVTTQLIAEKEALATQEAALAIVKNGVTDATANEINALISEGISSDYAKNKLFQLVAQEQVFGNNDLDTSQKVEEIKKLAAAFGYATIEALVTAETFKSVKDPGYTMEDVLAKVQNAINQMPTTVDINFDPYISGAREAADATDELTEAMEKQKATLEKQRDELQKQKEHYEQVIEAINWFYDKQIDKVQDLIDELEKQNELIQEQIDMYDGALSAIDRFYQKEIDAIQEKIDAMDKENEAAERQIALEKAQQALEAARNNRTIGMYTKNRGYVYVQDETAVKEAEDSLADANEAQIKAGLQARIDKLQEYRDLWKDIPNAKQYAEEESMMIQLLGANWEQQLLSGRIETVTTFRDNYIGLQQQIDSNESLIASYEQKIEYYESLKEQWEDLTNKYQEETYIQLLIGEFGNDYGNQLLNGRTSRWDKFANEYKDIQVNLKTTTDKIEDLAQAMEDYADRMEEAANRAEKAAARAAAANALAAAGGNSTHISGRGTFGGSAFAKGGIVTKEDAGSLDYIAKSLNEDHMIAVREGEAIIPEASVKANPELVEQLIAVNGKVITPYNPFADANFVNSKIPTYLDHMAEFKSAQFKLPQYELLSKSNNSPINITIGDIHLHGVNNVDELGNAIINQLPNTLLRRINKK